MINKKHPKYPIHLKRGTSDVPDDSRFHIVVDGSITVSTKVEAYAQLAYTEAVEAHRQALGHPSASEILARESARRDARALRAEGVTSRARRNREGGPGGRGGV